MTRSLDFIKQNWINSTHVQEQSAVVSMKESNASDTAVLITMKNNVNSTDDEWRFHEWESSSSYTRLTAIQT